MIKTWAIGVTTVPQRRKDLLPKTIASMKQANFTDPWLFVDGEADTLSYPSEFRLNTVCRFPKILTAGHWVLSLYELYIRHPAMERYAIFQDDVVFCKNVRTYLDALPFQPKTYWNLYTAPSNEVFLGERHQGNPPVGFHPSNQLGKGALALVFDREGVQTLLATRSLSNRPANTNLNTFAIDGGIQEALVVQNGYKELVHYPSLCQHTGYGKTTMGYVPNKTNHRPSASFPGEEVDALHFLSAKEKAVSV
jgi:hypothetical protein